MRILGVVGSRRKGGNTEILVKEALKGAREEGAEVSLVRLSDLHIQECNGCMACMLRDEHCRLEDDMNFLGSQMEATDGVVWGAPSYHYRPPGMALVVDDRLHGLTTELRPGKKAISIGVAAHYDRAGWVVPMLNSLLRFGGYEIVGSFLAISAGPGEVLLPDRQAIPEEVNRLGRDLVSVIKGDTRQISGSIPRFRVFNPKAEGEKLFTPDYCCPFCFSTAFSFTSAREMRCAFCYGTVGKIVLRDGGGVGLDLQPLTEEASRQMQDEHFSQRIRPTGDAFQQHRERIGQLRAMYREMDIPWLSPAAQKEPS